MERHKLIEDLKCPLTLEVYKKPYILVESGQIYDAKSLFENDRLKLEICPLTRKKIDTRPVPLLGYQESLSKCLESFSMIKKHYEDVLRQEESIGQVSIQEQKTAFFQPFSEKAIKPNEYQEPKEPRDLVTSFI